MSIPEQTPLNSDLERKPVTGWQRTLVIGVDRTILGLARHWAAVVFVLAALYSGLPFVAPVAMKFGWTGLADVIYTTYAPLCHQFAFRSWFLFGDHTTYPRQAAGLPGATFEEYASKDPTFQGVDLYSLNTALIFKAKAFRGNQQMGYKVAYCERDVAIYGSIGLFALIYIIFRKRNIKLPYMPFWLYLIIAIAPIGLDGFSQLFANYPFNGFGLPFYGVRESTPFLRVLTGMLFGLGNAWLAFPYLNESFADIREQLETKFSRAGIL